jgi:uncharacterized membrane protein
MSSHKSKLIVTALSVFLPGTGLNWLYLKGLQCKWFYIQLIALVLGLVGWTLLSNSQMSSFFGWVGVVAGTISLLSSWITALAFGLRPDEKWDAQFNSNSGKQSQSGWLVIICVIIALMVGAFTLMAGLAIAFEQFFIAQIEEARKLSQ